MNRNRIGEADAAFAALLDRGVKAEAVLAAWRRYVDEMRAEGCPASRYRNLPNFLDWERGDGVRHYLKRPKKGRRTGGRDKACAEGAPVTGEAARAIARWRAALTDPLASREDVERLGEKAKSLIAVGGSARREGASR